MRLFAVLIPVLAALAATPAAAEPPYGHVIRVEASRPAVSDIPLALPAMRQAPTSSGRSASSAAEWRRIADAAVRGGRYAEASAAYRKEAEIYRRLGDLHAAHAEEMKAARWSSEAELYLHRPATSGDARFSGARLEPRLGVLVGAFIDRDGNLPSYLADGQRYGDVRVFGRKTGKPHASFFMYRAYGQPFPRRWAEYLKRNGAIPHIAWEPRGLILVRDDAYLRGWVDEVRRLDWPVFIRFAGEMNGDWTPYHGNPAAYRQAFRMVYQAFRRAPKAAMIWCPNTVPREGIDDYYPGDDATDWVGVNFYSVLFQDNDRTRPAEHVHPIDHLEYVYRKYSARKPIAIGEYAATHQARLDMRQRTDFAVSKIAQLYQSLPTRYPRVKLVSWYNSDNIKNARPGRQLNNYLLTDFSEILMAYRAAIDSPYFLGAEAVRRRESSSVAVERLSEGARVGSGPVVEAWVRTYIPSPRVYLMVDGRVLHATRDPFRYRLQLAGLAPGRHILEVRAYDDEARLAASRRVTIQVP
ncbi:MAG: hypothetical protein FJX76_16335 [Armatimonadetes bacterium]|nr:hypothetical protein [Armatimonadota bacterium]